MLKRLLRRRLPALWLIFMAATLVMAPACGGSKTAQGNNSSTGFQITDDLGQTLSFDGPVSRIVSLAPSNTETVFAVGAGDKLVGRTDYCDFPPEAASVESVGGFDTPVKETIISLSPDVILAASIHDDNGTRAWLEEKGLKVVTLAPETLMGIMRNITLVGKLTGKEAEATQLVRDMQDRIDYVAAKTAGLSASQKPRVLHITWHDPLWTAGKGTFIDALVQMAGGVNVFSDVTGDVEVDLETAVSRNPQVIVLFASQGMGSEASYEYVTASDSPFRTTDAYLNDRIYRIDPDIAARGGPRIVDALEVYAKAIHPEIFD